MISPKIVWIITAAAVAAIIIGRLIAFFIKFYAARHRSAVDLERSNADHWAPIGPSINFVDYFSK